MDVKNTKQPAKQRLMSSGGFSVVSGIVKTGQLNRGIIPQRTYERYIRELKAVGVIRKIGYGVWEGDLQKYQELWGQTTRQNSGGDGHPIRGHGFHWKVSLPELLPLDKLGRYLADREVVFQYSKDGHGLGLDVRGYRVWVYRRCVMFYCPEGRDFHAWSASGSSKAAYDDLLAAIRCLENMLGGTSLKMSNGYALQCTHQHYAHIKDSLAKLVNAEKKYLEVRDAKGELWLLFDKSNTEEQETVHPLRAVPDWDQVIAPFYNDIREHYEATGELLVMTTFLKAFHALVHANPSLLPSNGLPGAFPGEFHRDSSKDRKLGDYIG